MSQSWRAISISFVQGEPTVPRCHPEPPGQWARGRRRLRPEWEGGGSGWSSSPAPGACSGAGRTVPYKSRFSGLGRSRRLRFARGRGGPLIASGGEGTCSHSFLSSPSLRPLPFLSPSSSPDSPGGTGRGLRLQVAKGAKLKWQVASLSQDARGSGARGCRCCWPSCPWGQRHHARGSLEEQETGAADRSALSPLTVSQSKREYLTVGWNRLPQDRARKPTKVVD